MQTTEWTASLYWKEKKGSFLGNGNKQEMTAQVDYLKQDHQEGIAAMNT